MNETKSSPQVTYWVVFAMFGATLVALGMWKRMSDAEKQKAFLGFR